MIIPRTNIPAKTKLDEEFDRLDTLEDFEFWIAKFQINGSSLRNQFYLGMIVKNNLLSIWLSPDQLEAEYGIPKSTQAKLRMNKKIPFYKPMARMIRYKRAEIDQWIEDGKMC